MTTYVSWYTHYSDQSHGVSLLSSQHPDLHQQLRQELGLGHSVNAANAEAAALYFDHVTEQHLHQFQCLLSVGAV